MKEIDGINQSCLIDLLKPRFSPRSGAVLTSSAIDKTRTQERSMSQDQTPDTSTNLPASAAIYSRAMLRFYDAYVLGFSNTWAWRCPSRHILALYDRQISAHHLEVAVGTGYFPDHCRFPTSSPHIDLFDIHPATLASGARRLQRYHPRCFQGNIFNTCDLPQDRYDSIAINYLMHCLSGSLWDKGQKVFDHLIPLLQPRDGRLFGSTILGVGVRHNALGQRLMALYNRKGIFGNMNDSEEDLHRLLDRSFATYDLEIRGCVALFTGYMSKA